MSEINETLLAMRDTGLGDLPERGDAGDQRTWARLEQEMHRRARRMPSWSRRRIRIGGFAVSPVVLLGVAATAAAATGVGITTGASTLFKHNPQGNPAEVQTVIASTVRAVDSVRVPGIGTVAFWYASTKQGGYCASLKLPDGSWAALNRTSGSGVIPGCHPTRKSQVVTESGGTGLLPTSVDDLSNSLPTANGETWDLYYGFVTAAGTPVEVRDPSTGITAPVTSSGFFLLAERQTGNCENCDNLDVLNASGQPLPPNYTYGSAASHPAGP